MAQGVEPVLRTYNTLIIACNMCGQPREAMAVYKRMLDEGYNPNATTYNALISAYGKAGQLDKARTTPPPPAGEPHLFRALYRRDVGDFAANDKEAVLQLALSLPVPS